jgi:CubicO group peptidase (beta-lactamase class C family)
MRSNKALGALAGILSLWNAATPAASEPEPLTRDSVLAMADRHFGIAEEAGGTAVVAVVKDGQVLAMKGYGFDKPGAKKIVDPSATLYRIGSVSKLFAAIATMQLIERRVIDPNADINAYLSKVGVKIDDRFPEPVTIRDLLALRAGRFDWTYSYYYPLHDDENLKLPPDEISRRLWRTDHPHDVSAYDNNGVGIIGQVAAAAAGVSYRELIRTSILEPLGMNHSVVGLPRNRVPEMPGCEATDIATAYQACPYDLIAEHLRPSGDMTVTAEDMTRFMIMLLNKGQLAGQTMLTPESWAQFVDFASNKLDPRLPTWGRIIYETFNGGRYAYGHDGGVGQFRTILRLYPAQNAAIFVSLQVGPDWRYGFPAPKSLSDVLAGESAEPSTAASTAFVKGQSEFELDFVNTFIPAAPPMTVTGIQPLSPNAIAGRYWTQLAKGRRFLLLEMLDHLELTLDVHAIGQGRIDIATPGGKTREYRETAINEYQEEGGSRSIVFAASDRGINANFTDASSLAFMHQLPWHYRPWLTIYPGLAALALLLTAVVPAASGSTGAATRRLFMLAMVGAVLTVTGLWAELQFALTLLYHGGQTGLAAAWRLVLHIGALILLLVPIYALSKRRELAGGANALKAGYVLLLCFCSWLVVLLAGYWGLLGHFTG